jgi:hypothetical protein
LPFLITNTTILTLYNSYILYDLTNRVSILLMRFSFWRFILILPTFKVLFNETAILLNTLLSLFVVAALGLMSIVLSYTFMIYIRTSQVSW